MTKYNNNYLTSNLNKKMKLFSFNYENKTNLIFITAIVWVINFRTSFKNIDSHMDTGCYASVKYDPLIILIKNIVCIFFILVFIYEKNISRVRFSYVKGENQKIFDNESNAKFLLTKTETSFNSLSFNDVSTTTLVNKGISKKIFYNVKIFFIILTIYLVEEVYFIFSNNHILDRIIVNMRNFWILIFLLLLSPLIMRKSQYIYRHQILPSLIILGVALFMILYNVIGIERFKKVFGYNLIAYFGCFFLMGLELSLIKYLINIEFLSIYLIIFLKGVIGTIIFTIINLTVSKDEFFNLCDSILHFEYDNMTDEFEIIQKIGYILTLIIIQYFKIFTINTFTENYVLASMMLSDLIYFPLYAIERFVIQDFSISNIGSFIANFIIGLINVLLMLIFNEILECKFFGLNVNLIKNINQRQNTDYIIGTKEMNNQLNYEKDIENNEENEVDDYEYFTNES